MKMVMDGEILASFFPIIWETFVVTIHNFVPNGALSMESLEKVYEPKYAQVLITKK